MKEHFDPKYTIINTEDGTPSLYSDDYDEAMHSTSGAYQEALLKHVYASGILNSTQNSLFVLDIGFGIGYNTLALIIEFIKKKNSHTLQIICLEKDRSYYPYMDILHFGDERDIVYKEIKWAYLNGRYDSSKYSIKILFGDARAYIKKFSNIVFNAIFHDPYSPSKNPELWSVDFFREVYRLITPDGILTTYSSAPQIRMALLDAGFQIAMGPSVGKKKEGTLASREAKLSYLTENQISELKKKIRAIPYRDCDLANSRENILNRRIFEMYLKRSK